MSQILWIAVNVATPLSLLGLVAALAYFAYVRRLKYQETKLQSLPADQRATAADEYLTRYGISGQELAPADKMALIRQEMEQRHRRSFMLLVVAAIVVVLCFGLAVAAWVLNSSSSNGSVPATDSAKREKVASMEELVVEMTAALEEYLTSTERAADAIQVRQRSLQQGDVESLVINTRMQDQAFDEFNAAEKVWLAKSKGELLARLGQRFDDPGGDLSKRWNDIIAESATMCRIGNAAQKDAQYLRTLRDQIRKVRKDRDALLAQLRKLIELVAKEPFTRMGVSLVDYAHDTTTGGRTSG